MLFLPLVLTGCAFGPAAAPSPAAGILAMTGTIHGGQQGVSGSVIQLYTVGKTGNGSAAKPMLTSAVTSDSSGFFTLTGLYTCADPEDQVYLTGTGAIPDSSRALKTTPSSWLPHSGAAVISRPPHTLR